MSKLWGFISGFFQEVVSVFIWILDSILNLIGSVFYWIFSGILTVIETTISAISFAEYTTLTAVANWDLLPTQLIWLLSYLNIGACLSMLAAAYTIRLALNLIPGVFTRV
jgi:hypothetical protein